MQLLCTGSRLALCKLSCSWPLSTPLHCADCLSSRQPSPTQPCFAVLESGGSQFKVTADDVIYHNKIPGAPRVLWSSAAALCRPVVRGCCMQHHVCAMRVC
jgi:hypothetical protein